MIPLDYEDKLRRLDTRLGFADGEGPLLARLRSLPPFVPLVVGAFAELNDDFEDLIGSLAKRGADHNLWLVGAPSRPRTVSSLGSTCGASALWHFADRLD